MTAIIPVPRVSITVREGTMADYAFIDRLQSVHSKQIGFLKRQALEGKIRLGQVIVAEDETKQPVGYAIGTDRYFKRDDVGIIYHLNVVPEKHRSLVGAQLVQAMFDKAHVSCRLFCLWCAQDIAANYFWESLGFAPIAFRAGSRRKDRVHIFWQKRIREGDEQTQWWYPTETTGGMMNEARLVFPIPPGVHWSDEMPRVLPQSGVGILPAPKEDKRKTRGREVHATASAKTRAPLRGMFFEVPKAAKEKPKREKPPKMKNDPALVAKARELNSRWLEEINNNPSALPAPGGKYQITKQIEASQAKPTPLLEAA